MTNESKPKLINAPHPWRIVDYTTAKHGGGGYLQIVDATGRRVCDFFPFAGEGGRGLADSKALAEQIVQWANQTDPRSTKESAHNHLETDGPP